jgi:hypothetical protein
MVSLLKEVQSNADAGASTASAHLESSPPFFVKELSFIWRLTVQSDIDTNRRERYLHLVRCCVILLKEAWNTFTPGIWVKAGGAELEALLAA